MRLGLVLALATSCHAAAPAPRGDVHGTAGDGGVEELAEPDGAPAPAVLVGAGDIAQCTEGAERTARLLDRIPGTIFVAGDGAYGTRNGPNPFERCFAPTWGRHWSRIRPALGNHDYISSTPDDFFDYFGDDGRAGTRPDGWYSYEVGSWHVVTLNSVADLAPGSRQDRWLRDDLARHRGQCAVVVMHHPHFSSGPHGGMEKDLRPTWDTFVAAGVSVVVSGHDHLYERFRRMRGDGVPDTLRGIRQFIAGTGGAILYPVEEIAPGSERRNSETLGVLKLSLYPDRYRWEFVPVAGGTFTDRGTSSCRGLR